MHGSTSTTTIVLTASLAVITTAAAFFVHQAEHKEKQERKSDHKFLSSQLQYSDHINNNCLNDDDDDDKDHQEDEGLNTPESNLLERQPSTMSCRSKRDRIVITEVEEKVKPLPVLVVSDGVPSDPTMKNDSATGNPSRLSCPEGVDVSFETTHSVFEELSSCDNEDDEDEETSSSSSLLVAAHEKAANDDDDDVAKSSLVLTTTDAESESKGMKRFLILAIVWFVGVSLATVFVGTTSFDDIYNWMEQVMITTITTLEKNLNNSLVRRLVDQMKVKEEDDEALLSAVSTAVTVATTAASRQIKGCYGPFVGDY